MNPKKTALSFIQAVNARDTATMEKLVREDYIQHNPHIPNGRAAFISMIPILEQHGTLAETKRVFQDGPFVVLHNLWKNATPFGAEEMVAFDVLRLDDQGLIAEHWDCLMPNTPPNASGRTLVDGPTEATHLDKTEENKARGKAMIEDLLMGKNPDKITEYISTEQYHQHNPGIKDGLDGLVEAIQQLTAQNRMFRYTKIYRVLGEGNFVLTISEGDWGGKQHAFFDLLRFENGKAVEHWDVIQLIPTEGLANENGMLGGLTP